MFPLPLPSWKSNVTSADCIRWRAVVVTSDALFFAAVADIAGTLGINAVNEDAAVTPDDLIIVDTATRAQLPVSANPLRTVACVPVRDQAGALRWASSVGWTVRRERIAEELFDVLRSFLGELS